MVYFTKNLPVIHANYILQIYIKMFSSSFLSNKPELVRSSCKWVYERGHHVKIDKDQIGSLLPKLSFDPLNNFFEDLPTQPEQLLQFLFVLDSLNFCFWPLEGFQFINLAKSIRKYLNNPSNIQKLKKIDQNQLIEQMFNGQKICLAEDRAHILNILGFVMENKFGASYKTLVQSAEKSAVKLLELLTSEFIFFQDHSIYQGHQIHFYKRAQLLIRHIYGIFEGKGVGQFYDIDGITIFPDYRIPQVLNTFKIFEYSEELQQKVNNKIQIMSGSPEQIQIRAATVIVGQEIKKMLEEKGKIITSVELDWALWFFGETNLNTLKPHHRTLTIYY